MTIKVIGEYQYNEKNLLGEGQFGKVYKGHHISNAAEIVAIKRIEMKKNPSKFLDREINILRELSAQPHPHIVRQLHIEMIEEVIYIVMEFCNGDNLKQYLKGNGGKLNEPIIKLLLKQLVNGMIVLHRKKIIHRDLKPENIMLCWNSSQATPLPSGDISLKIVDFGIGRFVFDGERAVTCCGTPNYMAPEIFKNAKSHGYDYKVDLWSIGMIIRQCITGVEDDQIHVDDIEPPTNCSDDLQDLLRRLLCEDPNKRIDYDGVLRHKFLGNVINVTVEGPRTMMLQINENDSVDSLIEAISDRYNLAGDVTQVYLYPISPQNTKLEYGSGQSLSEVGIENCTRIPFCVRQHGGLKDVATGRPHPS